MKTNHFNTMGETTMLKQIEKAFAEVNTKMFERQLEWAKGRIQAVKEYREQAKKDGVHYMMITQRTVELYGGKGWCQTLMQHSNPESKNLAQTIQNNVDKLVANRNDRIVKALTKKGITEINDFELRSYGDGYEGTFIVDGHNVKIETILAGGYNIQCLHQRTLIKVK